MLFIRKTSNLLKKTLQFKILNFKCYFFFSYLLIVQMDILSDFTYSFFFKFLSRGFIYYCPHLCCCYDNNNVSGIVPSGHHQLSETHSRHQFVQLLHQCHSSHLSPVTLSGHVYYMLDEELCCY